MTDFFRNYTHNIENEVFDIMARSKQKLPAPQDPAKPAPRKGLNTIELAKATNLVKGFEKKSIFEQIQVGRVIQQVFDECEPGDFMRWVAEDLQWSHGTSLNYRNLYALSKSRNRYDFAKLDITQTALYLAAAAAATEEPCGNIFCDAILDAAKHRRVSRRIAVDIVQQIVEAREVEAKLVETKQVEAKHQELAKLSGPEMEREYTALIQDRQLYEGACELPWSRYFKYRDQHTGSAPLSSDDLRYVGQWTNAAPAVSAPVSEAAPVIPVSNRFQLRPPFRLQG
jgi:hypothetical protein